MDLRDYVTIPVLVFKDIDIRLPVVSELKVRSKIESYIVSLIYRLLQTVILSLGRATCVIDTVTVSHPWNPYLSIYYLLRFLSLRMTRSGVETIYLINDCNCNN